MTFDDLAAHFGNGNKAAKALDIPRSTLYQWKDIGIPFDEQFRIQMKTKGKLRASVPPLQRPRRRS